MISQKELFVKAIEAIDKTTDTFYKRNEEKGYLCLEDTIDKITQVVNCIHEIEDKDDIIENKIMDILSRAMLAMEKKDTILLSDILEYELKEEFQSFIE